MLQPIGLVAFFVFLATWAIPFGRLVKRALHILQLEEYQTVRFWRWLVANLSATIDGWIVAACLAVVAATTLLDPPYWYIVVVAVSAVGGWRTRVGGLPPPKKPLVVTARMRRLIGGYAFVIIVIGGLLSVVHPVPVNSPSELVSWGARVLAILDLLAWPIASAANLLLFPIEAAFRQYYLASASRILKSYSPTVVGVAGSYGKTSTKMFVAQLLATRFPTLATPRSFNTPMGLCRVIRGQLRPEHRYFVAELGAYQQGEIKQLCQLIRPSVGILTAIGPEHLERFGSMENVIRAESELFEALPENGYAVVNGDEPISLEAADRTSSNLAIVGGESDPRRILWAEDVALTTQGLSFTLCHQDGRRRPVATMLLGRHNVGNLLLASAVALRLGVDLDDIPQAIAKLAPVEHRLQLVPNDNGVVVIDDTYNSNPFGAAAALEALASFSDGRKVLVTPGMVELADFQDTAHHDFGRQAAAVCDDVILIGPRRTQAIAEGLVAAGFDADQLIVTKSLEEATERLRGLLRRGDAVLFENDLPDNYSE